MDLSVLMPSHSVGARIHHNILNVCSCASDQVEVRIRDNSGDEAKREFMAQIERPNCHITSVDECSAEENGRHLQDEAQGEFSLFVGDDDFANGYAIPYFQKHIQELATADDVVGFTGITVVEDLEETHIVSFEGLDNPDPLPRLQAYLSGRWPSILQYSPLRHRAVQAAASFYLRLPVCLCFHDLLMNCLVLLHGRLLPYRRYHYQYFLGKWATAEDRFNAEAVSFTRAGLDSSGLRLQWLIAAFEGACSIGGKYELAPLSAEHRQSLSSCWYDFWYERFTNTTARQAEDARFDIPAMKIAHKWLTKKQPDMAELLADISDYYALSSPEIAERYHAFWQ